MAIKIDNNVKNQGKAPAMLTGLDSGKPTAGQNGRLYYATDTKIIYIDNGSAWIVFLQSAGGTISVTPNYIAKADASGNLIASAFYQDPTTGNVALNNSIADKGKLTITDNANRVIFGIVNVSTSGDDKTGEVRFYGYDGSTISTIGQIYQTNNNQTNTNAFKNSLNIKANRTDGTISFIVGGDTSANIKAFINNAGNFIIGALYDNGFGQKLQVTGGINTNLLQFGDPTDSINTALNQNSLTFIQNDFYSSYGINFLFYDDALNGFSANYSLNDFTLTNQNTSAYLTGRYNYIQFIDSDNGYNTSYSGSAFSIIDVNTNNKLVGSTNQLSRYYANQLVFNTISSYTQIKQLDLGTLSDVPMISAGFTASTGYKNNRGTITYTGGALAVNATATCTINFTGAYPFIPYGYVTNSTLVAGTHVQFSVSAITASVMTITIHNLSGGSIPSGTIKFNYLVIL